MTLRTARVPAVTLAAIVAASVFVGACARPDADPLALHDDGIGPLVLGRYYDDAVAAAGRVAPDSMLAGPGCGELDEVRYSGRMGEFPVSLMAMADDGVLVEVELGLDAPLTAPDEAACIAMRNRFAEPFVARFGQPTAHWELDKPVSREHRMRTGPVVVVARWFPTGQSCYVSVHYGQREPE
jgi:hypothetical protein